MRASEDLNNFARRNKTSTSPDTTRGLTLRRSHPIETINTKATLRDMRASEDLTRSAAGRSTLKSLNTTGRFTLLHGHPIETINSMANESVMS
jgi:hypothetical protein